MAKELPYFKFEPNQWDSGMIQLCSLESKGLFIEICCLYWSRLGDLPYALALQKLCNGNAGILKELEDNDIYDVLDGKIVIVFLDQQLDEFQKTSVERSKAARKRWDKSTSNANALQKQSKSNAIREEEIREDKSIEEVYMQHRHLSISVSEFNKLADKYGHENANEYCQKICNYSKNSKYQSLYLTALSWLRKDGVTDKTKLNGKSLNVDLNKIPK